MSGAPLDMTLDDLIKSNKKSGGRGRGRAAGPGPARRQNNRAGNRAAPYAIPKALESTWGHDIFSAAGRAAGIETGTKLYVSNLEYGVSNDDIKELFAEVGDLKRFGIHYDRSGRSKGTAEIVFSRRQDALAAIKRYNDVQLDGKPMKIDFVGTNISTPTTGTPALVALDNSNVAPPSAQGRSGFTRISTGGRGRGSGRGRGRGRGQGQGQGRGDKISADDLDADLEKYHADAMQTN